MTLDLDRRWLPFEGCANFRDLGGYVTGDGRRVRWRSVFRSDALGALTPEDIRLARDELGIRSVIDLRHDRELARNGIAAFIDHDRVHHYHHPLNRVEVPADDPLPDMEQLGIVYLWIARGVGPVLASVLRTIVEAPGPVVFHCAAGKDRTGMVAAALLELLEVPANTIVDDYALTELAGQALTAEDRAAAFRTFREEGPPPQALNARPGHMAAYLSGMEQTYGGVRGYLAAHGLDDALIAALRERMLE